MNQSDTNLSDDHDDFIFSNNRNLDPNDAQNNPQNLFEDDFNINVQNDLHFILPNSENEFQSIFQIESKYHSAKYCGKSKLNLPKTKKIFLDPPAVYSFKEIVETPNKIKRQNIKIERFLKARIALEKKLETIGLDIDQDSNQSNNDIASSLADEILTLQKYKIQNTQKELNNAIMEKDIYMQQPDLISPNDINPCKESKLVCLDELNCSFQPKVDSNEDFQKAMNEICQYYEESSFDISQTINLLEELS